MLQRNLVYTAITRGKRLVVLVGERRALETAVRNRDGQRRHSGLAQRLRTAVAGGSVATPPDEEASMARTRGRSGTLL
jgi:exodeoxyribonuclease V alpha subunit